MCSWCNPLSHLCRICSGRPKLVSIMCGFTCGHAKKMMHDSREASMYLALSSRDPALSVSMLGPSASQACARSVIQGGLLSIPFGFSPHI